jgi:hypothetical protein
VVGASHKAVTKNNLSVVPMLPDNIVYQLLMILVTLLSFLHENNTILILIVCYNKIIKKNTIRKEVYYGKRVECEREQRILR